MPLQMWSGYFHKWIIAVAVSGIASGTAFADPLDKAVTGPKLICFKYSTFMLGEDERISDFSGSPEAMSITVDTPTSSYEIGESEIFAPPKGKKRLVASKDGTTVYRVSDHGGRYAIFGRTTFSKDKDRLVIWLSGKGLDGEKSDTSVFDRFEVRDPAGIKCDRTFTYSWGL
jgi:hypothetical protein